MPTIPQDLPPFDIERQATIVAGEPGPGRPAEDETAPGMGRPLMGIGVRRSDGTGARFGTDVFLHRRPSVMPQFPAWLNAHRPAMPVKPGSHLYVSRARLGPFNGQSLQETALLDLQALCAALHRLGFLAAEAAIGSPRAELEAWLARMDRGRSPLRSAPPDLDERSRALIRHRRRMKPSAATNAPPSGDQAPLSP